MRDGRESNGGRSLSSVAMPCFSDRFTSRRIIPSLFSSVSLSLEAPSLPKLTPFTPPPLRHINHTTGRRPAGVEQQGLESPRPRRCDSRGSSDSDSSLGAHFDARPRRRCGCRRRAPCRARRGQRYVVRANADRNLEDLE